jgi:hypothetical protein
VAAEKQYYLLSWKWTRGDFCLWWKADSQGYTLTLDQAGKYSEDAAFSIMRSSHNDALAVAVEEADALAHRTVAREHIYGLRAKSGACKERGCPDMCAPGQDRCGKCIMGDRQPPHLKECHSGSSTWCGEALMEDGVRTYKQHEPVVFTRELLEEVLELWRLADKDITLISRFRTWARKAGWVLTKEDGWVCPNCRKDKST